MSLHVLDSDHLSLYQRGHEPLRTYLSAVPPEQIAITIISVEELIRGRLAQVRNATKPRERVRAYHWLWETLGFLCSFTVLEYDSQAESHFQALRAQKIRIGTHRRQNQKGELVMNFLTKPMGRFSFGIWVVLVLLVLALLTGSVGQLISVISWDTARSLGLQEDNPNSGDPMERSLVPVEWGTAVADVILQTPVLLLALYGIIRKNWIGLAGATMEFTILLYAALFFFFQRYGIKVWNTGDWTHWQGIATAWLLLAGLLGLLGLICLWSNREYFERK